MRWVENDWNYLKSGKGVTMLFENQYRTNTCGELRENNIGASVRVCGWIQSVRDHGGVLFADLRDEYGVIQVVFHDETMLKGVPKESVVSVSGKVVERDPETVNPKIPTGYVEVVAEEMTVLSRAVSGLPFEIDQSKDTKEELRLSYRFLDLRNPKVHENIVLRSRIISYLRQKMTEQGFLEIQTPILSASSPEGARDYLVPSRKHPGQFYALPQAPQIFKQLLMVSGFDRYFQIAPCFRDEDARADRSPGEFYQLDFEMAFATQEEVFRVAEEVIGDTFRTFSDKTVTEGPFPRIRYEEAMLKYGTDKPDLRNPLEIVELSDLFVESDFKPFRGQTVRGICVKGAASQSKKFFETMLDYAMGIGMKGLGYLKGEGGLKFAGPIDKFLDDTLRQQLVDRTGVGEGDILYFIADSKEAAPKLAGQIRAELGRRLDLLEKDAFRFCFIVDFPMYELNEESGEVGFTHNPFSMPQGGLKVLEEKDPLDILAYQYDIVCNGVELSSGAVRNHDLNIMRKAFAIAGYDEAVLKEKFGSLYRAFQYGAPPHAGMAPGVDRMVMLLTGEENIREVIAFPMNSNGQDLLMGAPGPVTLQQLREAHIKLR